MKSDEKIRTPYKIETGNDNLITVTFLKEETEENNTKTIQLFLENLDKIANANPDKKYNLITDMSPIPSATHANVESQKLIANSKVFQKFAKIAVVSKSLKIKVLIISLSTLTGKFENVRWFDEKEKALVWLNSPTP